MTSRECRNKSRAGHDVVEMAEVKVGSAEGSATV